MVAWWINLGANAAVTQMSWHVEYFKCIQGLGCQIFNSPPHPLFNVTFPASTVNHFYSNSPQTSLFSALLCSRVAAFVFCVLGQLPLLRRSHFWHSDTPRPTPTWRWQDFSDRKPLLDKTEASCVFNSSQMLIESLSSWKTILKPRKGTSRCEPNLSTSRAFRIFYEHLRMLDSQLKTVIYLFPVSK